MGHMPVNMNEDRTGRCEKITQEPKAFEQHREV